MFGLMKSCGCNRTADQREMRRLHYCGTCKTMGRLYGQRSRVLLNHDAVFLGELLSALAPSPAEFSAAYVSRNCMAIPAAADLPWALQYAATANVALADLKLQDKVADSGSRLARLAGKAYASPFRRAAALLASWKFPTEELAGLTAMQTAREQEQPPSIERLCEPTARATRLIFAHGVRRMGAAPEVVAGMEELGYAFGEVAYLVDAIKDREEDAKKGEFNALAATGTTPDQATTLLKAKQAEMIAALKALPLDDERKAMFVGRVRSNLSPILMGRIRSTSTRPRRRGGQVVYVERPDPCCVPCCFCAPDCCSDCACCCCEIECCSGGCDACCSGGCG